MSKKLPQKLAGVITGASTGIGRALAIRLAKDFQARLVINARTLEALETTKSAIESAGGEAFCVPGDVGGRSVPAKLIESCVEKFGDIDLLVNNAGLAVPGSVTNLTPEDWERVFSVNFFAALYSTYAALPHFIKRNAGKIVNISSVAGKVAFPGSVCYAASKFALTGMSEGMAAELEQQGIDVLTICPGWVRTEFFAKNNVMDAKNPTLIAANNDLRGLLMRYVLSISSERTADHIIQALRKGGSSELVLTAPGVAIERLHGLFPTVVSAMTKRLPLKLADTSNRSKNSEIG